VKSTVIGASVASPFTCSLPAPGSPIATSNGTGPGTGHATSRTVAVTSLNASVAPTVSSRHVTLVRRNASSRSVTRSGSPEAAAEGSAAVTAAADPELRDQHHHLPPGVPRG
jgi:hypothetical protein